MELKEQEINNAPFRDMIIGVLYIIAALASLLLTNEYTAISKLIPITTSAVLAAIGSTTLFKALKSDKQRLSKS